jgi:uncharacterized protein (DUF1015 family)
MSLPSTDGLSLAPFRALRYAVADDRLGQLLCPPYDVIDDLARQALLDGDADNAVAVILPDLTGDGDGYAQAAGLLERWVVDGLMNVDPAAALFIYEMATADGAATRGLVGAVELHSYDDGVILPHENTMAGPVADRLALMRATEANLEPIYLVYDGGGAASEIVRTVESVPVASATTPDGTHHRLWAVTDPQILTDVSADLGTRRALIADGHHRYATYLELQRLKRAAHGPGPWDRGLALLVDSSNYGPQVHAIHRVLPTLALPDAIARTLAGATVAEVASPAAGLALAESIDGFAAVLTDGARSVLVTGVRPSLLVGQLAPGEPAALGELDVTILHRALVGPVWGLTDDVASVDYAHTPEEAIAAAQSSGGTAVLLRPTPVAAVAAVAAAGARMPRKSTLFTPKPASGLLMRRFIDQPDGS